MKCTDVYLKLFFFSFKVKVNKIKMIFGFVVKFIINLEFLFVCLMKLSREKRR